MRGRDPRAARALGLWTAAWLGGLVLAGLLWVGDLSVQWPVLLVPVLWAAVALRPRGDRDPRRGTDPRRGPDPRRDRDARRDRGRPGGREDVPVRGRTDTVERPYVRERPERRRER